MVKNLAIGIIATVFAGFAFGQDFERTRIEQPFRVQVYTGGPSWVKMGVNFSNNYQDEVTYSGVPLLGVEFDYKIVDWFSIGVDASYRFGQIEFDILDSTFYTDINDRWDVDLSEYADPFGHYEMKIPRFRAMVKANFHVLPAESRADLYFTAGVGYNRAKPRLFLNDNEIKFVNTIGKFSLPVAYRTSVGYSYHFMNNLGVFAEVGLGGPIVSGGITARF